MNISEIVALVLMIIVYIIIGVSRMNYMRDHYFCSYGEKYFTEHEKVMHRDNLHFMSSNVAFMSAIYGMLFPFICAFKYGKYVGSEVYNRLIIKEDEEDRIASWFV